MIATLIVAGLFVIVGTIGGWIEYRGEIFCSGDCFRGRDA